MTPKIAVDITTNDKTDAGARAAERRFGAMAKKTEGAAKGSGFGVLGKQLEGLGKFKKLDFGFGAAGESLSRIGEASRAANENVGSLTRGVVSFGGQATGLLGEVAGAAGVAAGAIAGVAAAAVGLGVGTYMLGDKWAKTGGEIGRTAKSLAVTDGWLQSTRASAERFGVTADQTTSSVDALGSTLYDARYGANNLALGAMTQLGVKLKTTKDGAIDVAAGFDDIADAIARQKDPMVQKKLAAVFGMSAMLPALRQGSAALKAEGQDYLASGAALSEAQVAAAEKVEKNSTALKQHLGAIEKKAGMAAMGLTGFAAEKGLGIAGSKHPLEAAGAVARDLGHAGAEAGRRLVEGGIAAGKAIGDEFTHFMGRIERQESGGHQFRRPGVPLVSPAGAVGAMQVMEKTGQRAAARANIPWDRQKFYNDKAYNESIGASELWRLYNKYGGHQVLAATAYNAGEGVLDGPYKDKQGRRHEGWLKRFGDPRKGEISDEDFAARIPFRETKDYAANTARAHVEITLKGAPAGTVARVAGDAGVEVAMRVARSLEAQ